MPRLGTTVAHFVALTIVVVWLPNSFTSVNPDTCNYSGSGYDKTEEYHCLYWVKLLFLCTHGTCGICLNQLVEKSEIRLEFKLSIRHL